MSKLFIIIHNDLKVIYGQFLSDRNFLVFFKIQLILFAGFFKRMFFYIKIYKKNSMNESELRKVKKSDTLFIFGSGSSINEISDQEYENISKHDVAGFSKTILLKKVDYTFYLDRGGATNKGAIFHQKNIANILLRRFQKINFLIIQSLYFLQLMLLVLPIIYLVKKFSQLVGSFFYL